MCVRTRWNTILQQRRKYKTTYPFPSSLAFLFFPLFIKKMQKSEKRETQSCLCFNHLYIYLISQWRNNLMYNPLSINNSNFLMSRLWSNHDDHHQSSSQEFWLKVWRKSWKLRYIPQHISGEQSLDPIHGPNHSKNRVSDQTHGQDDDGLKRVKIVIKLRKQPESYATHKSKPL